MECATAGQWRKYITLLFQLKLLVFIILYVQGFMCKNTVNGSKPDSNENPPHDATMERYILPSLHISSEKANLPSSDRSMTKMSLSRSYYSFEVKEDTQPGSIVGKLETVHNERHQTAMYNVLEDDGDGLFLLSPHSGEFLLSRYLDYETERYYILTVTLQQGDVHISIVRVYFSVLDVNDNSPVFSKDMYFASLSENTVVGTCFLALNVSDKDEGVNAEIVLKMVEGNEHSVFLVKLNGELCLNSELDRERRSIYNLTVQANDRALPTALRLTSSADVIVLVEDVNDNAPFFVSAGSVSISEDTPHNTIVMVIQAEDMDSGSNGDVQYSVEDTAGDLFYINSTSGSLHLRGTLDREQEEQLFITLTATDKGSPRQSTSMNLTVHIVDTNDHGPEFSQRSYSYTVAEDIPRGTRLFQAQAHDLDIGANGQVGYKLSLRSPFVVDSVRGVVSVMGLLDREKDSSYVFLIIAVDRGNLPRSATAVVNITVLDVNDFIPLFYPATLTLHVMENRGSLSQLTHQVLAVDEDTGINSQLTYFIQQGNDDGCFSLNPNGTIQILESLDREQQSSYTMTIIAVDSGLPPLTGTATVNIIVDDMNDNKPEFSEDTYTTIVPEDIPVGTVFAMIVAFDIDDGLNGQIRYSMDDVNLPFSIEESSGELFTTFGLDRETVAIYSLTVTVHDNHPIYPLSSSVLVTVLVGDVNDNSPQFLNSPYVANVPAEMTPGSVVCAVRAIDEDTELNAEVMFSLYGHSADQFFISPHSGTVVTSSSLRAGDDITVNVRVEDGGEDTTFDTTTITIRFQNASHFPLLNVDIHLEYLFEDEPIGTLVAIVSAQSFNRGPVSFYLVNGNFEDMFQLHQSSGELRIKKNLDFENKKVFVLLAEARDAGLPPFSSYAEIHINISDINDNVPEFTQTKYRCEVFENAPATFICDVLAIDADSESYGIVQYSIIEGNIDSVFTIDSENGLISTTVSLDRENISGYNLIISATDKDNPLFNDTATVQVVVLDTNDHAPRFLQIFLTLIPEDVAIGYTVIQILAIDDDTGINAMVSYSLVDNNYDIPFSINTTSGGITVVRLLDREEQDYYVIKVNANDSAWGVSTDVTIYIADINDNSPVFAQQLYSVFLVETKVDDIFVTQVQATDADFGVNSQIFYVIEASNEEFWVNSSSGEIYTKQPISLHLYSTQSLRFTVLAFDCGSVSLYSNTTVSVTLLPYNNYPPTFLPFQPLIAIPFDMVIGTEVAQFTAVDRDFNYSNTAIKYVLSGGNATHFFVIAADSGRLALNEMLWQSVNTFLQLEVTAKDQGFPPLTSQIEITFEITERNSFSPHFLEMDVTFSVPEDLPVGSVIGKVLAEDEDEGVNGFLTYTVIHDIDYLPFSIAKSSGLITLFKKLDFENKGAYHFQIKAMDGGWISRTGTTNITVNIMDVNDNSPVFSALEYIISVPENSERGTTVTQMKATDADTGSNAHIAYSLIAGHIERFAIDSRNGTLTTLEIFDYEVENKFAVTIKASNMGSRPLFSVAHVTIQISGVNEFIPVFKIKEYNFTVSESVPVGTRIGAVKATDADQGNDGQVFYLLFGHSRKVGFDINGHTGDIYTTGDLRKQGYNYAVLKILAKNWGVINGTDVGETVVQISIINTNDPPEFTSPSYVTEVTEDALIGTSVTRVTAQDQDSILDWGRFSYSITGGNNNSSFSIDPFTGIISVNSPLDREQWHLYNLSISAIDEGSPPAIGTTNVIVRINDVNDNAPILIFREAKLKENQPPATIVAILNASDSDSPTNQGPFTYWFGESASESDFSLTSDGVLLTTRSLDREQSPVFHVLVAVQDAGIPPLTSTTLFHINILDENDNPPFQRNIYIEVKYYGRAFPGGMIGHVQPEDQDESDTFNCNLKNGPINMFIVPFGTCELWSSPYQGEATYNITVEATDQLHNPVNNSVYVNYKGFTNASMDSCILFYVSPSSIEMFLSHKYLRFVKALDSLFNMQASKTHVFGIKVIGNEILLLAAVKTYNGQYLSREIASSVSVAHKKLLEAQSNLTISLITSDPCLLNPCKNGASCNKNIHISQDVTVLESLAVVFVSPPIELFNCTCLIGFTGALCESDIDECVMDPCENGGTCVNNPGGFHCRCQNGFSGLYCTTDGTVDECLKVVCQNGGRCVSMQDGFSCDCVPGYEGELCELSIDHCKSNPCIDGACFNFLSGFSCQCPFGVTGVHCEEHAYGFEELSFMEFPPLDPRSNSITVEIATVQQNSLLLFNPGGQSSQEFLALEIVEGRVCLSYDLGSGPVSLKTQKHVADGLFHSITAKRVENFGSLQVDSCVDDEDKALCFSQNDDISSERSLDIGINNMTFGGIRSMESILRHPAQIQTHDFVGCVRNFKVNGISFIPAKAIASYNILERCSRSTVSPCNSSRCQNGGLCHDLWSRYVCQCRGLYTGPNCATATVEHALRLSGNAYIEYVIRERYRRDHQLRALLEDKLEKELLGIEVKFKSLQENGVLIVVMTKKGYGVLEIKDGRPLFSFTTSPQVGHLAEFTVEREVTDGLWHDLVLLRNGRNTLLLLDGHTIVNTTKDLLDLSPVNVDRFVLGAAPIQGFKQTGFSGCVEYFKVAGNTLPLIGYSNIVEALPSSTLFQSSCVFPDFCVPSTCSSDSDSIKLCLSTHCQHWSDCSGRAMVNSSCICVGNVMDEACEDCTSINDSLGRCSKSKGRTYAWIVAVILPVALVLIFLALFFPCRLQQAMHNLQEEHPSDSSQQKIKLGIDNVAFSSDNSSIVAQAISTTRGFKPPERQRHCEECHIETSPSSIRTGVRDSELEYYEIDSIYNSFHSDKASLNLSWHGNLYSKNCEHEGNQRRGDLQKGLSSHNERKLSLLNSLYITPKREQASHFDLIVRDDMDSQFAQLFSKKSSPLYEFVAPPKCLSVEEVRKLYSTLDHIKPYSQSGQLVRVRSTRAVDTSSNCETASSFTCSDFEFDNDFSLDRTKYFVREQESLAASGLMVSALSPVPSPIRDTCHLTVAHNMSEITVSESFKQWENILNMGLHFNFYADVFEDVAALPIEHDCFTQSDEELII